MANPESKQATERRLRHERSDLEQAILAATINWGMLEDAMAMLLDRLITPRGYGPAFAIYFTPENAATRFAIVDATIRNVLILQDDKDPLREVIERLTTEWGSLFNSLGRSRGTRNAIVHGSIRRISVGRAKRDVIRLAPSMFDVQRLLALKPGQVPGMSPVDVETAAKKFSELRRRIRLFQRAAHAFHHEQQGLPRVAAELAASRPKDDGRTEDAQTPPEQ